MTATCICPTSILTQLDLPRLRPRQNGLCKAALGNAERITVLSELSANERLLARSWPVSHYHQLFMSVRHAE